MKVYGFVSTTDTGAYVGVLSVEKDYDKLPEDAKAHLGAKVLTKEVTLYPHNTSYSFDIEEAVKQLKTVGYYKH